MQPQKRRQLDEQKPGVDAATDLFGQTVHRMMLNGIRTELKRIRSAEGLELELALRFESQRCSTRMIFKPIAALTFVSRERRYPSEVMRLIEQRATIAVADLLRNVPAFRSPSLSFNWKRG